MKKKGFLIYILIFGLFFIPKTVFGATITGTATVGRSAVMDTSNNYYYTNWTSLSSNSLNVVPIPYSGGDYYHMGSEYVYALTLTGSETQINGTLKIPVVSNTIYSYQLMNGLNDTDFKLGIHANFGQYNLSPTINNMTWDCNTYPHLGVAHNYCFYVITFSETLATPYSAGSYNLNFAVLNTNGTHSSYYYSGTDSNGCAIEFPVSASNSGYPSLAPTVSLTTYSGSSGGSSNQDIIDANNQNTQEILDQMQENYENLVNSQQVCSFYGSNNLILGKYLNVWNNTPNTNITGMGVSDYIYIYNHTIDNFTKMPTSNGTAFCLYDSNKSNPQCFTSDNDLPSNYQSYYYIRYTYSPSQNAVSFKLCQNGNQAINDKLDDLTSDDLSEFPSGGGGGTYFDTIGVGSEAPVSNIILLPINLLNSIVDNFEESCTAYSLPFNLWGNGNYSINLPCWTLSDIVGANLANIIDMMFCFFMIYEICMLGISFFEKWTSLEDTFDSMYTPRHVDTGEYFPKHGRG